MDRRAAALAAWSRLRAESLLTLAVLDEHFEAAAHIASRRTLGIRSGDALHLAIAAEGGHRLVTFDRAMAAAAPHIGVPVEPL
ncbi:MAG: PIN domain-containing protein [Pseudomonadota bacterium]